ncbi:MAG: protoheme IX farnesyltransferase [Bacteroidetes bacterium]|nr:protoheme IX farnesyltransferase [Bacteroidota bacterium]MBK8363268.1 protoheme IX farnesyltransferase [Bacteroidota bacterium]MBK9414968.1 protoheme IX farnesyltransferase [Bacteroidota bacterium]MBL0031396.1 protoheme IX farnesyltransferase [Bacteroidota bacterium]MBP6657892.1 heme o synthase [Bacteroidia bacterium]
MQQKSLSISGSVNFSTRIQDYIQLTKFRLSSLVVFSAAMGYIIAMGNGFSWQTLFLLSAGGFLVTGSSNAFNQIIEKDLDKLMDRTANRPLPTGRMTVPEAYAAAIAMGISGVLILWVGINPLCGILSLLSLLLYTLVYTPSKKITPFSVLIGAFPGAFPPLLGWVAGRNEIGMEALVLYAIQFIWQFPHFWAIAWVLHDDYAKAGFKMLPTGQGRTKGAAFQTLVYSICLIPLAIMPIVFGFTGIIATILMVITGILFTLQALRLFNQCDLKSAQRLMFGSFIYLPVVQIIWMLNKIL